MLSPKNIGTGILIVVVVLMGSFFFQGNASENCNGGPCPGGAQAGLTINPTNPVVLQFLSQLSMFSDSDYILKHMDQVSAFKSTVNTLLTGLGPPPQAGFENVPNQDKLKEFLQQMLQQINIIEANASSNPAVAKAAAAQLIKIRDLVNQYSFISTGSLVQAAREIIDYNHDGGKKGDLLIPYVFGGGHPLPGSGWPTSLDCSGFISLVLFKAGVIAPRDSYTTETFLSSAKKGRIGRAKVDLKDYGNKPLEFSTLKEQVDSGEILPGDIFLRGMSGGQPHVIMFLGKENGKYIIGESTGSGGPQYTFESNWNHPAEYRLRLAMPSQSVAPVTGTSGKTICIDPGHRSETSDGATGGGLSEKKEAYTMGVKLRDKLTASGYKVIMTKAFEDQYVTNKARAEICTNGHANLTIRLHLDSEGDRGWELYIPEVQAQLKGGPLGPSKAVLEASKTAANAFVGPFSQVLNAAGLPSSHPSDPIKGDQDTFVGGKQGGVLTGSYYATNANILIEMANLNKSVDVEWIKQDKNKDVFAGAIVKGVIAATGAGR